MISHTEGMCDRLKDLSARYVKVKQLQEKHKNLLPIKKSNEARAYQKEIASHIASICSTLKHLDSRSKGIIYICNDSYQNWEQYFYSERKTSRLANIQLLKVSKFLTPY